MPDASPTCDDLPERIAIIILAKLPAPGQVKTRLCPPCSPSQAAEIAEASLRDTLDVVTDAATRRPDLFAEVFISLERLGRAVPRWIHTAGLVFDQCEGDLGDRLTFAFRSVGRPAILIGMDTPQVTADLLVEAATLLRNGDSVIGPATDGGFWIIGLRTPHPQAFQGVPMSSDKTGLEQVLALKTIGLTPAFISPLTDFDDFDDALAVAALMPGSRTQRTVDRIAASVAEYAQPDALDATNP